MTAIVDDPLRSNAEPAQAQASQALAGRYGASRSADLG